jgi:hypothetical protein
MQGRKKNKIRFKELCSTLDKSRSKNGELQTLLQKSCKLAFGFSSMPGS